MWLQVGVKQVPLAWRGRYELETGLMDGSVKVADLPRLWNERMQAYLGCTPKDDAQGVLQDVHWCAPYSWQHADCLACRRPTMGIAGVETCPEHGDAETAQMLCEEGRCCRPDEQASH